MTSLAQPPTNSPRTGSGWTRPPLFRIRGQAALSAAPRLTSARDDREVPAPTPPRRLVAPRSSRLGVRPADLCFAMATEASVGCRVRPLAVVRSFLVKPTSYWRCHPAFVGKIRWPLRANKNGSKWPTDLTDESRMAPPVRGRLYEEAPDDRERSHAASNRRLRRHGEA